MVTIEQSRPIFGLIAKVGCHVQYVKMVIKNAIISPHLEDQKLEHKDAKEAMNAAKYLSNYAKKY